MIGDPPVVTLRRDFPRPTAAEIAAFRGVQTGFVADAQNGKGALDYRIKPLSPDFAFVGPVITVAGGPRDNLGAFVALEIARPGDVILVQTGHFTETAVMGDLLAAMAKNKGIAALVTDGLVRDVAGLLAVGLPVFASGVSPNSCYKTGPCTVGLPISMGNVIVESGDLLIGDRDGIALVRRTEIQAVTQALEAVRESEAAMDRKVREGLQVPSWVGELLASPRTRVVD